MLYLIVGLLLAAVCLIAFLWVGTFLFQGYIYTEPSQGLYWQAPAAGLVMTCGFAIWCFTIAFTARANVTNIPINTLFRFTPNEDMFPPESPASKIWAIKSDRKKTGDDKDGEKVAYVLKRDSQIRFHYVDTSLVPRPWNPQDVIAIEIEKDANTKIRFDLVTPTGKGENRQFRSSDGWVLKEDQTGPTGNPERFRLDRLLYNVFFNFAHLAGWFLVLCLLLRFQWTHALGLAVVLWLIFTLAILPMMLASAADVAGKRQTMTALVTTTNRSLSHSASKGRSDDSLAGAAG